jgi:lipopolysaccharide/colanic/teichoic acid biosynthesis glycosyltransferase
MNGGDALSSAKAEGGRSGLTATRIIDVIGALGGLVFTSPLMLCIAMAIRLESTGPVFFSQIRLGRGGGYFRLYKFRKFRHVGCGAGPAVTMKNDARLTWLGKLLERSKMDELPQLWNILKGDMSLVGPRPETLEFADCFTGPYREILNRKPGIFGPNQVFFRNECGLYPENCNPQQFYREVLFPTKARIDLNYYSSRTWLSDTGWIVRGVLAVAGWPASRDACVAAGRLNPAAPELGQPPDEAHPCDHL